MRTGLSTVLFVGAMSALHAQALVLEASLPGHSDTFTTDEMGNMYVLRGDELELFDARGSSWLRNSVKTFGRIHHIDAFYSLKPMVFSPEQGQLAMLDNTLSVQGSVINLPRQGYPQVVLACVSVQNGFWFFDERDMELRRVDAQLRPLAATGRLDQLLGITMKPVQMQEADNMLYVNDPAHGILVFDIFGAYYRTIPILGATRIEVREMAIYHFKDGVLRRYDRRSFDIVDMPMPEGIVALDARMERGRMYVRTPEDIRIYRVVQP